MLKPLTLSLSLAIALGACSVSMAGGLFHGNSGCSTCGLASPQGVVSAPVASGQCDTCAPTCAPRKHCNPFAGLHGCLSKLCTPKPKCYTYTWVLKKKRVWGHGGCGNNGCNTCATPIYATGQAAPSGQGAPAYGAPQTTYAAPAAPTAIAATPGEMTSIPAGDEAPPAPAASINGPQSSLLLGNPSGN